MCTKRCVRRIICTVSIFCVLLLCVPCPAVTNEIPESLISFDTQFFWGGLRNLGIGGGLEYEKALSPEFAFRLWSGAVFCLTEETEIYNFSVHFSGFLQLYPFRMGLDRWYLGVGSGIDFFNFFGNGLSSGYDWDLLVSVIPITGYKLYFEHIMFDFSLSYRAIIWELEQLEYIRYHGAGLRLSVSFSFDWAWLFSLIQ